MDGHSLSDILHAHGEAIAAARRESENAWEAQTKMYAQCASALAAKALEQEGRRDTVRTSTSA